jgi:hypothetical protein
VDGGDKLMWTNVGRIWKAIFNAHAIGMEGAHLAAKCGWICPLFILSTSLVRSVRIRVGNLAGLRGVKFFAY